MKTYSTNRRLPTAKDGNSLGYVMARRHDAISYSGVKWDEVTAAKYDRWCLPPVVPEVIPGTRDALVSLGIRK